MVGNSERLADTACFGIPQCHSLLSAMTCITSRNLSHRFPHGVLNLGIVLLKVVPRLAKSGAAGH